MSLTRWFIFCAAVAIATACSGGGTSTVTPRPTASSNNGQGSTPALDQTITFTVDIPAAPAPTTSVAPANVRKHVDAAGVYLSPNTGSISIRLVAVNGVSLAQPPPAQPATNVPVSCRGSATGCHVSIAGVVAAIGANTYSVTTFAGANGEGAVVSTGVISVTVTGSGTVSTIGGDPTQIALGGYVASLGVTVAPTTFKFGVPSTATVVVSPKDAAGATIVGNAQFAFPIVLSVTGAGFTLSGPGLQSDGTLVLVQPQAPSPPILLKYDGTGTGATVNAASQNGSGAPVNAPPVVLTAPTPTPMPTNSATTTLPPVTPTPIVTGPTPSPTAAPSSFYVLNAFDSTIFEFSEPVNGIYSDSPRRGFGGATAAACSGQPQHALLGITSDPAANVYVGYPHSAFDTCSLGFYAFTPAFVGPGAPSLTPISLPGETNESDGLFQLAFDSANGNKLDVSDDSIGFFVARVPVSGGKAAPTLGYPVKPSAFEACFVSPGLSNPDPTCGNGPGTGYFDETFSSGGGVPFAVGPDGSLYIVAFDATTGQYPPVILKVTPPNQLSAGTITAEAAWLEGPNTLMSQPVALAVDASRNSLWVYDAANNGGLATPPPIAGPGTYLLEFPLSVFSGAPGAQNVAPAAFLSGQTFSRFASNANANFQTVPQPNDIAVGDGKVFVANLPGPYDGIHSTPPPSYNGEVDAYSDTITGINENTVAPIAIFYGGDFRGPIAVSFGPHGTALGTGGLLQAPPNLPQLRARFMAQQRLIIEMQRRRRDALRARLLHR